MAGMINLLSAPLSRLFRRHVCFFATALGLMLSVATLYAQTIAPQPLIIDASTPATVAPAPANYTFDAADARAPDGHLLGLNAQYLTLDGKPWLPVMGEIHYSRVPESEWENEILKMKSAGVQIVGSDALA